MAKSKKKQGKSKTMKKQFRRTSKLIKKLVRTNQKMGSKIPTEKELPRIFAGQKPKKLHQLANQATALSELAAIVAKRAKAVEHYAAMEADVPSKKGKKKNGKK
jgi:hypothetical protein